MSEREASVRDTPKTGELVPLVVEGCDTKYGILRADGRYREAWVDTVHKIHPTGKLYWWPTRRPVKPLYWQHRIDQNVHRPQHDQKEEDWRLCGALNTSFPASARWITTDKTLNCTGRDSQGRKVNSISLYQLTVHTMTQMKQMKKIKPPDSTAAAWQAKEPRMKIPIKKTWKIECKYCTPKDQLTWLKVQHKNLYLQREEHCLACGQANERVYHLCMCSVLRTEFWSHFLELCRRRGVAIASNDEIGMMLATGRINDEQVLDDEASGIIFIAWRVLYAEIIHSRIEETRPSWKRAAKRGIGLLINRMTARGEYWRKWYKKIRNTSKAQPFPRDHQKHTLISIDDSAHYTITPELQHIYDSI